MWHYQLVKYPDHIQLVEMIEMGDLGKGYAVLADIVGEDRSDVIHMLTMMLQDIAEYPVLDFNDLPK